MIWTWALSHWKVAVLGVVILILALGGVQWCRKPPPLKPVEETTAPAKAKIDKATETGLREIIADRELKLAKEQAENARLRKAAESKVTVPFETALKGGMHAMAELATLWTTPGTAEQLRNRWRPTTNPADQGR